MSTQPSSRRSVLTWLVTVAAVLIGPVTALAAASATPAASPSAACAPGAVKAVVGGHTQCLKPGARCQSRFAAQYRAHGFACVNGRLRKLARPKPPASPIPPAPPIPNGPAPTTVGMPPATPLPAGTATVTPSTAPDWSPNVAILEPSSDAMWVSGGVFRIDQGTNSIAGPFTGISQDIGVGEGSVWASDYNTDQVLRLDPATGKQLAVVALAPGSAPEGITDADGAIWVARHHGGAVSRIDPQTNKVVANVVVGPPGSSGPQGIASGLGSIWVDVPNINSVVRIDPSTNKITAFIAFPLAMEPCGGIAIGSSAVWVTACEDDTKVARIDPATNKIASILEVGGEVVQPAADGDSVWFVAGGDPDNSPNANGYLIHLGADDHVEARIDLGPGFISGGTAVAFGSIWTSDHQHPRVLRIPQPN